MQSCLALPWSDSIRELSGMPGSPFIPTIGLPFSRRGLLRPGRPYMLAGDGWGDGLMTS